MSTDVKKVAELNKRCIILQKVCRFDTTAVLTSHSCAHRNPNEKREPCFYGFRFSSKWQFPNKSTSHFITAFCPFWHWNFQSEKDGKRVMKRLVLYPYIFRLEREATAANPLTSFNFSLFMWKRESKRMVFYWLAQGWRNS